MANGMFAGGVGTEDNPYLIEDIEDLNAIRNNLGAYYRLISNINMNIYPYNDGAGWDPIDGFYGTLDGDGYIISNLYINRPDRDGVGLFGMTPRTSCTRRVDFFKNIILENVNITGRDRVAALLGDYNSMYFNSSGSFSSNVICTKIYNIFISGSIKGRKYVATAITTTTNSHTYYHCHMAHLQNVIAICDITSENELSVTVYSCTHLDNNYTYCGIFLYNCISICDAHAKNSKVLDDYLVHNNCYYLNDSIAPGQYISPSFMKGLSQKEMYSKSYKMFSELIEAKTTSGYNFFEFNYGCPPTYNHKRHKSVLVEYDNKYHCYNHKNNKWVELNDSDPIHLANNSIEGLDIIPNTSWDEINGKNPKIVNIVPQVDKYVKNTDSLELAYSDVDSATLNSADKCIARTKITLDNNKFLEQIDI